SWRQTMWLVAALGVVAATGIALGLPPVPSPPPTRLAERLAPARDRAVALILAATLALFTGIYLVTIYLSVIMAPATGGDGGRLTVLLFASGCAGTLANLVTGRWTDRFGPRRVLTGASVLAIADFALMPWASSLFATALAAAIVYGLASWSTMVPQQHRLIAAAPAAASLVVSLNASTVYVAVALAGALGGAALHVLPAAFLPWLAAVFLLLGLGATLYSGPGRSRT
ncbi:MFS transporter, partial [Amycolatopsis rhizosphaerae]